MSYYESFSGYCPEENSESDIELRITKVPILGRETPGIKISGYRCAYQSQFECKTAGASGANCPLYTKAIQQKW